eukprot:SAG22_NODE_15809_length_340_cov_0.643154_1_plen_85_part_01
MTRSHPYGGQYAFGENAGKDAAGDGGFLTFEVEGYEGAGQDETFYRDEMLGACGVPATRQARCCGAHGACGVSWCDFNRPGWDAT